MKKDGRMWIKLFKNKGSTLRETLVNKVKICEQKYRVQYIG